MDVSTTQMLLVWTLLGFLLAWMVTFAVLALRSKSPNMVRLEDLPTPAETFPAVSAAMAPHMPVSQPAQVGTNRHDTSGEMKPVTAI